MPIVVHTIDGVVVETLNLPDVKQALPRANMISLLPVKAMKIIQSATTDDMVTLLAQFNAKTIWLYDDGIKFANAVQTAGLITAQDVAAFSAGWPIN